MKPATSLISFRTPSLVLFPLSVIPSLLYTFPELLPSLLVGLHSLLPSIFPEVALNPETPIGSKRSALLTDILALSFSHNALSLLKIDSFKTGTILLSGLFLYDIWWVFGTEVVRDDPVPGALVWYSVLNGPKDGEGCYQSRRAHQTSLAQELGILHEPRLHDAGPRRYRHPRDVHCSGIAI
jgi:hypothetical protein